MRIPLENLSSQEIEPAIYYGDSNVNIGDPFKITCIISISASINWVKDGEPITKHNLRHWRDEHSFITSESAIDGKYSGVYKYYSESVFNYHLVVGIGILRCYV